MSERLVVVPAGCVKEARKMLCERDAKFSERRPFPWFSVHFTLVGEAHAIEQAARDVAAMVARESDELRTW